MTSRSPLTVLPVTDRVTIVCLAGTLDADSGADLARELGRPLDEAARHRKRLVLDISGVALVSTADAIADLAARGLAVAVLSDSMTASYRERLTAHTIGAVDTPALLALIWKNTHSPGMRELLVHSRQAFTKPDPSTSPRTHGPAP